MQRKPLLVIGVLGIAAVALYVGATLLGSVLDSGYSQIANAISELTGPDAPNRAIMAPIYIAYSFATAVVLLLSAPAAVASIGTDVMGLFERITIGVFMVWLVVVAASCLVAARTQPGTRSVPAAA